MGELDALLTTEVRNGTGLLRTERLVFLGGLTPAAGVAPLPIRSMTLRLPRCFNEQQKAEPGCR